VDFSVWSTANAVTLVLDDGRELPLQRGDDDWHSVFVADAGPGTRYRYRLDGDGPFPDPASRYQPEGVHGPSEVTGESFAWTDAGFAGIARNELVIYELHVGTFSREGTFAAVAERLPHLRSLGVTAIELMPVHDFPGERNWGYDPAAFWAPSRAYGRPDDLRALVDAAHAHGIAVILDVVYNHFGPDGAYAAIYAPFFHDTNLTPWGPAIDLDGPRSANIRRFFLENALHWLRDYHFDGLRLDATFALIDRSAEHFLGALAREVATLPGPRRHLIAEDHRNLASIVAPRAKGGMGLHAQWSDDFHHIVRRLATGDRHGYFADYPDTTEALATVIESGWLRGEPTDELEPDQFVFYIQNHDQVGNRPRGARLSHASSPELYRALSALLLFVPQVPLLFMGQEWASERRFQFFTDHEETLGRRIREGRRREFSDFPGFHGVLPDPQAEDTFRDSTLDWSELGQRGHAGVLELYRDLIERRRLLHGRARCVAVDGGLRVARGEHQLCLALRPGVEIPGLGTVAWSSEAPGYGGSGEQPEATAGGFRFRTPGALWLSG